MAAATRLTALLLAAAQLLRTAGSLEISIPSMDNITITIKPRSSTLQPCKMCILHTSCVTELKIMSGQKKQFRFDCSTPEKYFVMEIQRNIDCITGSCPFGDVHLSPSGLPRLNKTFIWNVKASKKVGLQLKFSTPWLRQIGPTETCPDLVTYNISNCIDTTTVNIGTFCRNGSVSRVKVQGGIVMSLQIPWDASLTTSGFNIANRSSIKRLCIIESTFKGASSATLMSPNYPLGFPEDELMTWQFVVPSNLRGCDQDAQNPGILRLLFQVIVQHPQNEENVTYFIDLSKERNLTMTILPNLMPSEGRLAFEPVCLICKDPRTCDHNLTLTSGTVHRISFLCNDLQRLKITAEKTIACWDIRFCHRKSYALTVPTSIAQLPIRLDKFVWKLLAPEEINVEIVSPSLKLQQHVSELKCNASYSYGIVSTTQRKELNLGVFCPGGAIEKIQMRDNITITFRTFGKRFLNESVNQDLKMSFVPFIKEECIFTVTPDPEDKVYLQTPNWYDGLPPHVTVSWNITVPRKQAAHLTFSKDRMGIACETGRAYVNIKEQKPRAEEIVRREDEPLPEPLDMYHHFWVNISNCKPVDKKLLSLQFRVTFMQRKTDLVVIIAAVVGAGLLIAIGFIICCIRKKKKKNQNPAVGVYNANVGVYTANVGVYNANINTRMPGKQAFFRKRREDNNSHVYAVIDEAMVYGHLLKESKGSVDPEVDVYRPFDGPIGDVPPTPPPLSFRKEAKVSDAQDLPSLTLTDTEIYTFAHHKPEDSQSNGDTNSKSNGDMSMSLLENKEQEGSME
ncbi:CUB domain-containing protein 1 [Alligator mississippiensis]|uniref:CUB domain-containing protein 1 n=1 Tax=Alligator mississippiensis TaxID=8496 RepID=A0A151P339_ALLMI|nr:CUB domain-containing protein 1 [Alligator mississippiensis]